MHQPVPPAAQDFTRSGATVGSEWAAGPLAGWRTVRVRAEPFTLLIPPAGDAEADGVTPALGG